MIFYNSAGITSSTGVIHDFQGPSTVGFDDFAFGPVIAYVPLDTSSCFSNIEWDEALDISRRYYEGQMVFIAKTSNILNFSTFYAGTIATIT